MDQEAPRFSSAEIQSILEKLPPSERELIRRSHDSEVRILSDSVNRKAASIVGFSTKDAVAESENGKPERTYSLIRRNIHYQHLFNNTSLGIYQATLDGKFLDMNPALAGMLGYVSAEEAIASINDIPHQMYAFPEKREQVIESARQSGGAILVENRYLRRDGTEWTGMLHLHIVGYGHKERIVEGFIQDVTEIRRTEADVLRAKLLLERTYGELNKNHQRLRAFIDRNMDGVIRLGTDGKVIDWNPQAEKMFGFSKQEALGESLSDLIIPERFRKGHELGLSRHREGHTGPFPIGTIVELSGRRKDGSEFPVEISVSGAADKEGMEFIGFLRDITRRKASEAALEAHKEELERKISDRTFELIEALNAAEAANRAKSAFLSNMSHEIRTPMNGILWMANILAMEGVSPKQASRLEKITVAGNHLLEIINDILDLSKIESGIFTLESLPVNVNTIMSNVRSIVMGKAKEKSVYLRIEDAPTDTSGFEGDATRLQQGLLNFVANAIKFTPSGTITIRAVLESETVEWSIVRFEVEDTGVGIPQEAMQRIFNAFEQGDNATTRKYGGTGLGLTITKRLAEAMEGTAWVTSEVDKGSIFWFTAKLKKVGRPVSNTPVSVMPDYFSIIKERFKGSRILVVDDDVLNREVATVLLEEAGLVVDQAEDGQGALDMLEQHDYSAVFMDMQMPVMNGSEATRRIRQTPKYCHVPILAMTANVFAEDRKECLEAGMNDFLGKPYLPDEFFKKLLFQLGRRAPRRE